MADVASKAIAEYPFAELHRPPASPAPPAGCPTCGAFPRPASDSASRGISPQTTLPQPIADALLLVRTLTPRERTVFQFLGFGHDNRSIARALMISERTVKRYVTAILTKLKLESRLQAGLTALLIYSSLAADSYWPESPMDLPWAACDT
jgi:DNA-binding CsgD family transcriptional regulator